MYYFKQNYLFKFLQQKPFIISSANSLLKYLRITITHLYLPRGNQRARPARYKIDMTENKLVQGG